MCHMFVFLPELVALTYISGIVIDIEGSPIYNALVSFQGETNIIRTDRYGRFKLSVEYHIQPNIITAGKFGYFNGATVFSENIKEYRIILKPILKEDNKEYEWLSSKSSHSKKYRNNLNEAKPCEVCHPAVLKEWLQDAHSTSAANKVFLSFFNGTDQSEKTCSPGYRLDFPKSNGNCASCHVPALALNAPFHADPNKVEGVAKEGIFCDFCHKISGVSVDQTGGRPGVMSYEFQRPDDGHQVFYGPYSDVYPGEDGYHPLYKKSHYCAPCHHGKFWDILVYSEFQEWLESSYRKRNIHCQDCHMPSLKNMTRFALENQGGVLRNPDTIPSHVNLGIQDEAFMKEAIDLSVQSFINKDALNISVTIKNTNAGHHYPTGNPMRNMILLVEVKDDRGYLLDMFHGERVPVWGGVGSVEKGNFSGLPGKGFAKVLKDAKLYPDKRQKHFSSEYPAPHWRPTYIESDNRIPADGKDKSSYQFQIPKQVSWPISVSVRLIFRRTYKKWSDAKGLDIPDMVVAAYDTSIRGEE